MGTSHNLSGDDDVVLERVPPEGGFDLYRYKDAEKMRTTSWRGYYWARHTAEGDYEIRSVPAMPSEHSVPGGIFPEVAFEKLYEKVDP
jgi:hypothetical protein